VANLILAQTPGLVQQPASALAAGQPINGLGLARIQNNADYGAVAVECFYQEVKNGDTALLPQSSVDGYKYQWYECVNCWETRSTVRGVSGQPAGLGGLLVLDYWVDPSSQGVECLETYFVQGGGSTGPIADGVLAVWTFGVRGRGYTVISPSPAFTFQADASYATGQPLTQSLLQGLDSSALFAGVRKEVFMVSAGGSSWQPNHAYATNALVHPTVPHANGCTYTAALGGTSGPTEPVWPTIIGSGLIDGNIVWNCTARGFTNGQTFTPPASPVDGYAYGSSDTFVALPSWISTTGPLGPTGPGRMQRLQKSITQSGTTFTVNTAVTYWDGTNQTATNDGVVNAVLLCERAMTAYPSTPPAYNVFSGAEFMTGQPLMGPSGGSNTGAQLAENVNNAAVRPEFFLRTGLSGGGSVPVATSPVSAYTYTRSETMNIWTIADTGTFGSSTDAALRLMLFYVDPATGLVSSRIDYNTGGGSVTTRNGSFAVTEVAARQGNVLLAGVAVIPTIGTPTPVGPGGGNIVPNYSFELWNALLLTHSQFVGTPDDWVITNATVDGYTTRQPGLDSTYAVGLNVGNAHGAANTQFVSILSLQMPITAGENYSWKLVVAASPAITSGLYLRYHFRDVNFANDVYFNMLNNIAVGTSATTYSGTFGMPVNGSTSITDSAQGTISLVGTMNYTPIYCYVELWNFQPNVSSTIIADDCQLLPV
jgi:hypothetical protein